MKKIFVILLSILMLCGIVACEPEPPKPVQMTKAQGEILEKVPEILEKYFTPSSPGGDVDWTKPIVLSTKEKVTLTAEPLYEFETKTSNKKPDGPMYRCHVILDFKIDDSEVYSIDLVFNCDTTETGAEIQIKEDTIHMVVFFDGLEIIVPDEQANSLVEGFLSFG